MTPGEITLTIPRPEAIEALNALDLSISDLREWERRIQAVRGIAGQNKRAALEIADRQRRALQDLRALLSAKLYG